MRFVTEAAAIQHFGLDKRSWNALLRLKLLPPPVALIGLYDLKALDRAFDRLSGLGSPDDALEQWERENEGCRATIKVRLSVNQDETAP